MCLTSGAHRASALAIFAPDADLSQAIRGRWFQTDDGVRKITLDVIRHRSGANNRAQYRFNALSLKSLLGAKVILTDAELGVAIL